jgi:NADH-quinone oxidoreductase subunit L
MGLPGMSGFYSKDAIIMAVEHTDRAGASFAQVMLIAGVFVTAAYSFRLMYLAFHGAERMDEDAREHAHEPSWVVTVPLILLAIPSVGIAWFTAEPLLFGNWFGDAIRILPEHDSLAHMREIWDGPASFALHGFMTLPVILALSGAGLASWIYLFKPEMAERISRLFGPIYRALENKYWFDELYQRVFARGAQALGSALFKGGDEAVIDGVLVNGSARGVGWLAGIVRRLQTGHLYTYAFAMIIGLILLLGGVLYGGQILQ